MFCSMKNAHQFLLKEKLIFVSIENIQSTWMDFDVLIIIYYCDEFISIKI